jgi:N-acylneuraminate cytidylyltransferase/CMP-N,N'-diacetyllegionaminic acid synthase
MKRICTICARGGSKGLAGKNLRTLMGKPLLAHSIEQAQATGLFEVVVVSSDDPEILLVAEQHGADMVFKRPDDMATDEASKLPAIRHAVLSAEKQLGFTFEVVVDLDVTSPLRTTEDIKGAVEQLESTGVANILTGSIARKNPYFNLLERRDDGSIGLSKPQAGNRIERRQDAPECYDCNAAVYVWQRDIFVEQPNVFYKDTNIFEMPENRSHDIDTAFDFDFVEFLMKQQQAT